MLKTEFACLLLELVIIEKSEVCEMLYLLRIESIIETLRLDLKNSSSGSY